MWLLHYTKKKKNIQRDATTQKGRHFVGLEFSTSEIVFNAGFREVASGKSSIYVSCTNDIINEIQVTTKGNDIILLKF